MNLQKAREILKRDLLNKHPYTRQEVSDAKQLGNEALKVISKLRHWPFPTEILQLPGETDE